jgi:hypothetical protein
MKRQFDHINNYSLLSIRQTNDYVLLTILRTEIKTLAMTTNRVIAKQFFLF